MWSCVSDAKDWSLVNKLELSEDKAKALLLVPSQSANLPASLQIGQTCVHFADSARNISVSFDSSLSMRDYISKVRKIAYLEMRRIRFIRKYFTTEATKTQVSSLVISCLEYYNYLLADIPQKRIATLQITGFLCLTESNKKNVTVCYSVISGSAPPYLTGLLRLYTPSRSLRSSADSRIFHIPIRRNKFKGQHAFSYTGPVIWNSLPFSVHHTQTAEF